MDKHKERITRIAIEAMNLIMAMDCYPTDVSYGYVSKTGHCEPGLVLKKVCPKITNILIAEGYSLSVHEDGVHVEHFDKYMEDGKQ